MNSKQRKTLEAIFAKVILRNIRWSNFESMFIGLGFTMIEGDGSKVSFERDAVSISFHRPHPQKEVKPYQIKAARAFLDEIGEKP